MKSCKHVGRATLVTLVVLQAAHAQTISESSNALWPDTPACKVAFAFVEAFNADDEEAMRLFTLENRDAASLQRMPIEQRMQQSAQMRQQLGKLAVGSVTAEGDLTARVIAKSSSMQLWLALSFELQAEQPHKLAHFSLQPTAPPKAAKPRFAAWETLHELAEQACQEAGLPAVAIAVVNNGAVVERAVAGVRQQGGTEEVRLADRFQIGSVSKAMTATWIGILIDQGKLSWRTTIAERLADIDMRDEYRTVTLEQLLQHRAGLPPYTDDTVADFPDLAATGRSKTQERALFVRQVLQDEPANPAGTFNYSNAGYAVAVLMAERAAAGTFEELMHSMLFTPTGMLSADFGWPASNEHLDQPRGHSGNAPDLRVQAVDDDPWQGYMLPAGGVSCSIEDLARFALLHLNGLAGARGLLHNQTLQRLHLEMSEDSGASRYAAGWVITLTDRGEPKHSHSGSAGTFYASLALYPESDLAIAIATNCAGTAAATVEELSSLLYAHWSESTTR